MTKEELMNKRFEALVDQARGMAYKKYSTNIGRVELDDLQQESMLKLWECCEIYADKPELDFTKLTLKSLSHALALYCKTNTEVSLTNFQYSEDSEAEWEVPDTRSNIDSDLEVSESIKEVITYFATHSDKLCIQVISEIIKPSEDCVKVAKKLKSSEVSPKVIAKVYKNDLNTVNKAFQKVRVATELFTNGTFTQAKYEQLLSEGYMAPEEINWSGIETFSLVSVALGFGLTFKRAKDDTIQRMWAIKALNDRGILPSNELFKIFRKDRKGGTQSYA